MVLYKLQTQSFFFFKFPTELECLIRGGQQKLNRFIKFLYCGDEIKVGTAATG